MQNKINQGYGFTRPVKRIIFGFWGGGLRRRAEQRREREIGRLCRVQIGLVSPGDSVKSCCLPALLSKWFNWDYHFSSQVGSSNIRIVVVASDCFEEGLPLEENNECATQNGFVRDRCDAGRQCFHAGSQGWVRGFSIAIYIFGSVISNEKLALWLKRALNVIIMHISKTNVYLTMLIYGDTGRKRFSG